MSFWQVAAVGAGGALGALFRHGLGLWARTALGPRFPYGTLLANLLGCLLIGVLLGLHAQGRLSESLRLALVVGLLGGFTTYSSFAFEAFEMLRGGRLAAAAGYLSLSLVLGLLFVGLGWGWAGGSG